MQIIGTLFGAVINYILMTIITTNQRDVSGYESSSFIFSKF